MQNSSLQKIAWVALVLMLLCYTLFQGRHVIAGPLVDLTNPLSGATVHEAFIEIAGTGRNIAHISLDDRPIFIDEKGAFTEPILLAPGYNIITVKAADRFGREIRKGVEVVYQP